MTKEKSLYQAKLIIEQLPEEEYSMLPIDRINYINENCEYDENIIINPDIPLSEQNIDEQTIEILEDLLTNIDYLQLDKYKEDVASLKIKLISLENEIDILKDNNNLKMGDAKKLVESYKKEVEKANIEISNLKKSNQELYSIINKIPKFLRRMFIKRDINQYYISN